MSRQQTIERLRTRPPVILPSLLLCDFAHLDREVRAVEQAGARALHLDVMDGSFVPNITYGMPIVRAVRRSTNLPLDCHLMISRPAEFIDEFVDAGADVVTVHAEALDDPRPALDHIRRRDAVAGLAINPATPPESIAAALPLCDMVLCMSVHPGFGAQEFDPVALEKLRSLKAQRGDSLLLEVDGGVNAATIGACVQAGAQMLVVGSAIFKGDHSYGDSFTELNALAAAAA
jgi:ribulose-phosphate 3-epimerase